MSEPVFRSSVDILEKDRMTRYRLKKADSELSYAETLVLWQTNPDFRRFFIALLADSPFNAYRWETPALSSKTQDHPFEFVLINTPSFSRRKTDSLPFTPHFSKDEAQAGICVFPNLHRDAILVVPSPRSEHHAYGHLAAFIRNGSTDQVHALWEVVGQTVSDRLQSSPLWLNTAGGGVAWLHVRLDSQPKYYHYAPYTAR